MPKLDGHEGDARRTGSPAAAPSPSASVAAFFDSGGLNAGTPVAIASVPVSATEPRGEGAQQQDDQGGAGQLVRRRRRSRAAVTPRPGRRSGRRRSPIISSALPTNRYVGIAKMLPDSRRPRRLPSVIRHHGADRDLDVRRGARLGSAEMICSDADEIETATVSV